MIAHRTDSTVAENHETLELAHAALDELGVPRRTDGGTLTLFGRIEALRAGMVDAERLTRPLPALPLRRCPRCGLMALMELGAVCPSCSAELDAHC